MKSFPKQRLSYSEKIANNYQWCKDTMDSLFLNYATDPGVVNASSSDYERKLSNYQLYNNLLNQKDFERECNPMGLTSGQYSDEIMPYNKAYNKIQVLLGEEVTRPFDYKVILTNSEGIKSKLAHKDALLRNFVYSRIQDTLASLQRELPEDLYDPNTLMDPQEIEKYMNTKYLNSREITATKILQYLVKHLGLKELKSDAFKHALISGEEIAYVGMENGEPIVEVVNPLGFFYHKSAETKYIQDGLYAGYRTFMTSGDVMDKFGQYMSKEDLDRIDYSRGGKGFFGPNTINPDMRYYHDDNYYDYQINSSNEGSYGNESQGVDDHLVQHVEWRSQKKVGFIEYKNEYGESESDVVSEDFEVPISASRRTVTKEFGKKSTVYSWMDVTGNTFTYEAGWIPEVWSGVRVGDDIYCMMGPKQYQFRNYDNPYKIKLGYHGLVYNAMNASSVSPMDRMKPFQYLYFVVMHKLKKLIAQDKGRIFHLDATMIDPKLGWDKTLYYLTNLNLDVFNPLQNTEVQGWSQRGKVSGSTDMSVADQIMNYVNLLQALDQQIAEAAGVTREREGQVSQSSAVTNAQSNIQMSAIITEVYFQAHSKLWEQILTSLVDTAQVCYKHKSMVKQFILDDMSLQTLQLTPDSLTNASFGIFVTDSGKEAELFHNLKSLGQALIQNDKASFSDLIKLFKATSTSELERQIIQSEKTAQARDAAMQQHQMEAQMEMQQALQQYELEKQARDLATKVKVAEIQSFARQMDQDINDNNVPDQLEIEKLRIETALKSRQLALAERKQVKDEKFKEEELKIKSKQANKKPSSK